jgi:hypothetical protein
MTTNSSAKSMNNMKIIGAAIIVIIIVAIGAVVLTGSKTKASNTLTTVPPIVTTGSNSTTTVAATGTNTTAASTVATTTVASSGSGSIQAWSGQNLSITQFSAEMNNYTFTKAAMLNATYNYKSQISFTGQYSFSENTSGTTNIEKYYNSSRITTMGNAVGASFTSVIINNATSGKQYVCTTGYQNSSFTCILSKVNINIVNSTGILGSVGSNVTISGYFNNIQVTSATYNGQPCTLVTGDLYLKTVTKTAKPATSVIQGTESACLSSQYNAYLNQSLKGTFSVTENGNTTNANMDYSESEIHVGSATSAAITALPGPVTST